MMLVMVRVTIIMMGMVLMKLVMVVVTTRLGSLL